MGSRWVPVALGLSLLLGLSSCGGGTDTVTGTGTSTAPPPTSGVPINPAAAADPTEALIAVLQRAKRDPHFNSSGFRTSGLVTDDFVARIDRIDADARKAGGFGIDFDPFFCAQQIPKSMRFEPGRISGDTGSAVAHLRFGGSNQDVSYQFKRMGGDPSPAGNWLLDTDDCVEEALKPA